MGRQTYIFVIPNLICILNRFLSEFRLIQNFANPKNTVNSNSRDTTVYRLGNEEKFINKFLQIN